MLTLTIIIIAFAFFAQSLLGFGGGLICIPLLSLFMPVQDVVTMVMIYQVSIGLLIFSSYKDIEWSPLLKMLPSTIVGSFIGVALLNYLHGDIMRGILAAYIIMHLARKHTRFDPLRKLIRWGDEHLAGFLGGMFNSMIGSGAPAFILYLKGKVSTATAFRASIMTILMLTNIPRIIGTVGAGLMTMDLFIIGMYAFPGFLLAMYAGQKLHDKVPQEKFFLAVEILLACSALMLIFKILLH